MSRSLLNRQSELPRSVPLFRYAPDRAPFSWRDWNPNLVRSAADIPPYLILGDLDASTFENSAGGWSARWQGTEDDTYLDATDKAKAGCWEMQFPSNWDREARSRLQSDYQLTVIEQPENGYSVSGSPLAYPITVDAKLVFQALNYLEGKAPEWTSQQALAFNQSVVETGLAPQGFPVREEANDGSAAWTLRREIYFLFVGLPFAGLTDFLSRMATPNGPIRRAADPDFRFELRPIVMPAAFERQTESLAIWDTARTTRSFLQFAPPGQTMDVPKVEDDFHDASQSDTPGRCK